MLLTQNRRDPLAPYFESSELYSALEMDFFAFFFFFFLADGSPPSTTFSLVGVEGTAAAFSCFVARKG
jgi:hypothetical protein